MFSKINRYSAVLKPRSQNTLLDRSENLELRHSRDGLVGLKMEKKTEQHLYSCDNQRHFWADGVGDYSGVKFF